MDAFEGARDSVAAGARSADTSFSGAVKRKRKRRFETVLDRLSSLRALGPTRIENRMACGRWLETQIRVDPSGGNVPESRLRRKREQISSLCAAVASVLKDGDVVVDFCSGSGHAALPLAYEFPRCHFVLCDARGESLAIGRHRVQAAGLTNVSFAHGLVHQYQARFDIGISLHGCGDATDHAIARCHAVNA